MRLKVVIHEYAHSLAHKHLLNNHQDYQEHRNKYETEAESIAYVVSKYLQFLKTPRILCCTFMSAVSIR